MTPSVLKSKQEAIQQRIYEIAKKEGLSNENINAIPDGVADCEGYLNTSPRVAWILKEPYDYFLEDGKTPAGGGWLLYCGFLSENKDWEKNKTWRRIIYTMYGLRNHKHYRDMDYISNSPEMGDVMKETVILNLSKMPARTTSDHTFALNYEKYWAPILKEQIELYDPDVIIFGNTFEACWPIFVPEDAEPIRIFKGRKCFIDLYRNNDRLLLYAYHPSNLFKEEFYIDSLIDTINKYYGDNREQRP